MKQISQLLEETIQKKDNNDFIFESVNEFETLEEAINQFNELPHVWKKYLMTSNDSTNRLYRQKIGKDSEVVSVQQKAGFRTINAAAEFVKKQINTDGVMMVWVEVNGEPFYSIFHQGNNHKNFVMISNKESIDDFYRKRNMTRTDPDAVRRIEHALFALKDRLADNLRQLANQMLGYEENYNLSDAEFKSLNLNITVKGLKVDEKRLEKKSQRENNRKFVDSLEKNRADSAIIAIKFKLSKIQKYITKRIEEELEKVQKGGEAKLPDIMDNLDNLKSALGKLHYELYFYKGDNKYERAKYIKQQLENIDKLEKSLK